MRARTEHDQLLTQYLLGNLPEDEQLRVEQQFFSDDQVFDELLAVEDELVYEYALGHLAPGEQERFAQRFLTSAAGERRVAIARGVVERLATQPAAFCPTTVRSTADTTTVWQPGLAWAATVLLAIGLGLLGSYTIGVRRQLADARAELDRQMSASHAGDARARAEIERERAARAELERRLAERTSPAAPSASSSTVLSLVIAPGLLRDAPTRRVELTSTAAGLQLQLTLPRDADYSSFNVTLRTAEGREVWRRSGLRPSSTDTGRALVVTVPAASLIPADYELSLQGTTGSATEDVAEYYFTVVRAR